MSVPPLPLPVPNREEWEEKELHGTSLETEILNWTVLYWDLISEHR